MRRNNSYKCPALCCPLIAPPAAGGTWSNVGLVYTYTVAATPPCTTPATATVTVTEQPLPNAGTNGTLTVCAGTTPTNAQLFAALGGSPAAGGTWSNVGLVYTYTVAATPPCTTPATATVTVTEQPLPMQEPMVPLLYAQEQLLQMPSSLLPSAEHLLPAVHGPT